MIEPPRQFVGRRILEIDNDVFAAAELIVGKVLTGLVRQTFIFDFRRSINVRPVET